MYYVTAGYVLLEIISLIVRIIMANRITGMKVSDYFTNVIRPTLIIVGISTAFCLAPHFLLKESVLRLILTSFVYGLSFLIFTWYFAFDQAQREGLLRNISKRFKKKIV